MGSQRLMVLMAFLLFAKDREVSAQYASIVDCLPAASAAITRPVTQSAGQYVLPVTIQPVISAYDSYAPDLVPGYSGYNSPAPFPGYPPIIIDDDNDIWHKLLYFLIFALKNKKANSNTPPSYNNGCNNGCNSCNCGCCNASKNGCSCSCCNCKDSDNSTPTYIPVPIAIPVFTGSDGCPYFDSFPGLSDDIIIQSPSLQATNGKDCNEINLIIRADC